MSIAKPKTMTKTKNVTPETDYKNLPRFASELESLLLSFEDAAGNNAIAVGYRSGLEALKTEKALDRTRYELYQYLATLIPTITPQLPAILKDQFYQPGGVEIWYANDTVHGVLKTRNVNSTFINTDLPDSRAAFLKRYMLVASIAADTAGSAILPQVFARFSNLHAIHNHSTDTVQALSKYFTSIGIQRPGFQMDVGDVIYFDGEYYIVSPTGFDEIDF